MTYDQRSQILETFRHVRHVLPCDGPQQYAEFIRRFKPGFFCHGDDWKTGPQSAAREEAIQTLQTYGGQLIEPTYTAGVSSSDFQDMFRATLIESRHTGVLVRTCLNDLKRVPAVIEKETGLHQSVLKTLIDGKDMDRENVDSILRLLSHNYPVSLKQLVVDVDHSVEGVWHMSAAATTESGRVLDRVNGLEQKVHYYNYMDTATTSLSPFKPELIEQLVHVTDEDPMNPLVVMNKGHLLSQLTFFIGPVNFYSTVRGERQCKAMNTGDSCLITPYVPHSFTSRDPNQYAAIVAVTFSGYVRDALSDMVHHDIHQVMSHAGNRRDAAGVLRRKLERFSELRGMCVNDLLHALEAQGHSTEAVQSTFAGSAADPAVLDGISDILNVPRHMFEIAQLEPEQEVTYTAAAESNGNMQQSTKYALASCKHQPEAGGYNWHLCGEEKCTSQFFNYIYNYGDQDVYLDWGESGQQTVSHGDSVLIKPFVQVKFEGTNAKLVVCKAPGWLNESVMHECSLFAEEGLLRMSTDTNQWW